MAIAPKLTPDEAIKEIDRVHARLAEAIAAPNTLGPFELLARRQELARLVEEHWSAISARLLALKPTGNL